VQVFLGANIFPDPCKRGLSSTGFDSFAIELSHTNLWVLFYSIIQLTEPNRSIKFACVRLPIRRLVMGPVRTLSWREGGSAL